MGATFLTLLILTLGLPLLESFLESRKLIPSGEATFLIGCPPYSFWLAFESQFGTRAARFWQSVALLHFFGWCGILFASRIVTHTWQDKAATPRGARWRERWQLWSFGDALERRVFRTLLLEGNPILWLAGRNRLKYSYVWGFLGVCGCLWLWGLARNGPEWLDEANYIFTALVLHTVFKLWLASEACQRFQEDRNLGALELLLSTPMTIKEIIGGQLLALQRQFSGAVLVVLAVDIILLLASVQKAPPQTKHMVALTKMGKEFLDAKVNERKRLLNQQLRTLHLFQKVIELLHAQEKFTVDEDLVLEELAVWLPTEKPDIQDFLRIGMTIVIE